MALTDAKIRILPTTKKAQMITDSPNLRLDIPGGEPDKRIERGARCTDRFLSQLRGILNLTVEQGLIEVSPLSNRLAIKVYGGLPLGFHFFGGYIGAYFQ